MFVDRSQSNWKRNFDKTKIAYWTKQGENIIRKEAKRKTKDVIGFQIGGVHYTVFINKIDQTFYLVGKYPNASSKNFLLLRKHMVETDNLKEIKKSIYNHLCEYSCQKTEFIKYVQEQFGVQI